jgi:hypothetical protein
MVAHADDEPAAVAEFVSALNARLTEVTLHHGAATSWKLVRSERPLRH